VNVAENRAVGTVVGNLVPVTTTIRVLAERVWKGRTVTRRMSPVRGSARVGTERSRPGAQILLPTLRGARVVLARSGEELVLFLYRRRRGAPRVSGRLVANAPVEVHSPGGESRGLEDSVLRGIVGDTVAGAAVRGSRLTLTFGNGAVLVVAPSSPGHEWSLFGEGVPLLGYVEPDRRMERSVPGFAVVGG
jgi:hypothetical protein